MVIVVKGIDVLIKIFVFKIFLFVFFIDFVMLGFGDIIVFGFVIVFCF